MGSCGHCAASVTSCVWRHQHDHTACACVLPGPGPLLCSEWHSYRLSVQGIVLLIMTLAVCHIAVKHSPSPCMAAKHLTGHSPKTTIYQKSLHVYFELNETTFEEHSL